MHTTQLTGSSWW